MPETKGRKPEDSELPREPDDAHPATFAARRLLGDHAVMMLKGILAEGALHDAINGADPLQRELARLRYQALDALFDSLRRYARGEFSERESELLMSMHQGAQARQPAQPN